MQNAGERESLISVKETAELLECSRVIVYRRYHTGVFPGRKIGRKIDIHRPFVVALHAAIRSGRSVDVDEFAAAWKARNADPAAELEAVA